MNAHLRSALLLVALAAGCDRPVPPPPPVAAPPAAAPRTPLTPQERLRQGALLFPAATPEVRGPALHVSMTYIDFEVLRRNPGLEGRVRPGVSAVDIAVSLGVPARDVLSVWLFEFAGKDPAAPASGALASIVRVASLPALREKLEARVAAGTLVRESPDIWRTARGQNIFALLDDLAVFAVNRKILDLALDTRAGKRPAFGARPGFEDALARCDASTSTFFASDNPRYSRLRAVGPSLLLGASLVNAADKLGVLVCRGEEEARRAVVPVRMQLAQEAEQAEVTIEGRVVVVKGTLEQTTGIPVEADGDFVALVRRTAGWLPPSIRTAEFSDARAVTVAPCPEAEVLGIEPSSLHLVARAEDSRGTAFAVVLGAPTEKLAEAAAGRGWKSRMQGPLQVWETPEGEQWAAWQRTLLRARDAAALEAMLDARYGSGASVASSPGLADALASVTGPSVTLASRDGSIVRTKP